MTNVHTHTHACPCVPVQLMWHMLCATILHLELKLFVEQPPHQIICSGFGWKSKPSNSITPNSNEADYSPLTNHTSCLWTFSWSSNCACFMWNLQSSSSFLWAFCVQACILLSKSETFALNSLICWFFWWTEDSFICATYLICGNGHHFKSMKHATKQYMFLCVWEVLLRMNINTSSSKWCEQRLRERQHVWFACLTFDIQ